MSYHVYASSTDSTGKRKFDTSAAERCSKSSWLTAVSTWSEPIDDLLRRSTCAPHSRMFPISRMMLRTYVPRPQQTENPARPPSSRDVRRLTLRMNTGRVSFPGCLPTGLRHAQRHADFHGGNRGGICALHPRKDAHAQSILRSLRWEMSFSDVISPEASSGIRGLARTRRLRRSTLSADS